MPQGVRAYPAPGHDRPQLLSPPDPAPRRRRVNIDEPPMADAPIGDADLSAACSSRCIGTILDLLPLPARTLSVGGSASSERSATSSASASAMRSPALHCSSISSLALGLSVALMIASTSCASRYSGSFLVWADLSGVLWCAPRGRRLRATAWVVLVLPTRARSSPSDSCKSGLSRPVYGGASATGGGLGCKKRRYYLARRSHASSEVSRSFPFREAEESGTSAIDRRTLRRFESDAQVTLRKCSLSGPLECEAIGAL